MALRGTPTTVRTTPSTKPRTQTTVRGSKPTTTTTTRPARPSHVLGIGDSVMQGAKAALMATIPGMAVDAARSRQFSQAIEVVKQYQSLGALPNVIVIHLGTNGRITNDLFDQMMRTIGPGKRVYFLTARVPRLWEAEVNATLHEGATRWPTMVSTMPSDDWPGLRLMLDWVLPRVPPDEFGFWPAVVPIR